MISFIGANTGGANDVAVSVPWPAGVQSGDVAVLFWSLQGTQTPTDPAGFLLQASNTTANSALTSRFLTRVCDGSETGSVTVGASTINKITASLLVYRGVHNATPLDGTPQARLETTAGATHPAPAITTGIANAAIVTAVAERSTSGTSSYTPPAGYTKRAEAATTITGMTITTVADDGLASGRPSGTVVSPGSWSSANAFSTANVITWTVSLRPAPGASGTGTVAAASAVTGTGTKAAAGAGTAATVAAGTATGTKQASGTGSLAVTATLTGAGGAVGPVPVVEEYLAGVAQTGQTATTSSDTEVGWWLLAFHGWDQGSVIDMPDPGAGAGAWELLAVVDAGNRLPAWKVWARKVTSPGAQVAGFAAPPAGGDNHAHLYVLSGLRQYDTAERCFSVGGATSAAAGTAQTARMYSPDKVGTLIGAWLSGGGTVNYTMPAGMAPRAELDGLTSSSRAGEEELTAGGPGTRGASTSTGRPWVAVTVVARSVSGPVLWPSGPLRKRIEIAPNVSPAADPSEWADAWVDITEQTYARDSIVITRGRGDESSNASPSKATVTLKNTGGQFTRTNPLSPYYGQLRRNTPLRVWLDAGDGWELRHTGFVSEWPPRRATSGHNQNMPVTAAGILRRLGQGKTLRSAMFRAVTSAATYSAYWSLEDPEGATRAVSGLTGGLPMVVTGPVQFGQSGPPGSAGAVSFDNGGGKMAGTVAGMPASARGWLVSAWLDIPVQDDTGAPFVTLDWSTPGALTWQRYLLAVGNTTNGFALGKLVVGELPEPAGSGAMTGLVSSMDLRGKGPTHVAVRGVQGTGSAVTLELYINGVRDSVDSTSTTDTLAPITVVRASNGFGYGMGIADPNASAAGTVSHIVVASPDRVNELATLYAAGLGYAGETAAARIARLSVEEGVPAVIVGATTDSTPMGPQGTDSYLSLIREAEAADGGVLYEARDSRIAYQVRAARYNAPAVLTLDHAAGHVRPPLEPTDDDQGTRNDVEVTRTGGSSVRVVDDDHVDQVGRYDDSSTINVATDNMLGNHAGWRLHLGTRDALRYPLIAPNLLGRPVLVPGWAGVDIGQRVDVTNPPPDLPPDDIRVFVEGYTETITATNWTAEANASPVDGWSVAVLDDYVLGHLDTEGSQLAVDVDATTTTLAVATTDGPLWTTDPADCPFDLIIGGEVVTVTAITGSASPQTMTVLRAVNGVAKAHTAGADVRLSNPMILAL